MAVLQIAHNRLAEDGGYWWWHTPDDTFDKVDFQILKTDTDLYADALAALLAAPVVPVDLVAEVEALGELVSRRESLGVGRFDLTEVRSRQRQLLDLVRRINVHGAETPASESGIDLALVGILRPLHRVVYTLAGAHHPDPAVDPGLLPGLAPVEIVAREDPTSDRYHFAEVTMVRERNRLLEALDQAIEEAERLRARLGGGT